MMTDCILKQADNFRLGSSPTDDDVNEANWIIDRLSAEVERLRAALPNIASLDKPPR